MQHDGADRFTGSSDDLRVAGELKMFDLDHVEGRGGVNASQFGFEFARSPPGEQWRPAGEDFVHRG